MKAKNIALSLTVALVLSLVSIAGATDSGPVPTVKSSTLVATGGGKAKPGNLSVARPSMKEGEILVKFKNTLSTSSAGDLVSMLGGSLVETVGKDNIHVVTLPEGMSVEQAVNSFSADSNVAHAQPNYRYYPTAIPNDASYDQLWGLHNTGQTISDPSYNTNNPGSSGNDIDAQLAWDEITDCSAVVVAVIDTSINYTHEDLASNMWDGGVSYPHHGYDFVDYDNDPMATDGQIHGGHVAGTIGARGNNSVGTAGVCWQVEIMAVRVLGPSGGFTSDIIQGIEFASDNGAHVINMSLGGGGGFDSLFSNAITYARDRDVVVVVAAGNEANNNDGGTVDNERWPCNFTQDNLICVAALDQAYALASFSNIGTTSVDVGAPGTNILSAWPGNVQAVTTYSDWTEVYVSGSGWRRYSACDFGAGPLPMITNPDGWCDFVSTQYADNTDSTIYKEFDLSGLLGAGFTALAFVDTEQGFDYVSVYASGAGGNPAITTPLFSGSGSTGGYAFQFEFELDNCLSTTCSIGYRLQSDGSVTDIGVAIFNMEIQKTEPNSSVYVNINGTSMASPHVAGIAALVRAYNPQYTYLDTVNAILEGGEATPALTATTTTGKAANAMGSLAFISTPTGVSATP